jgi:hypothetical protein
MPRDFVIQTAIIFFAAALVLSIHFIPNRYCTALFGLPCDVTQNGGR